MMSEALGTSKGPDEGWQERQGFLALPSVPKAFYINIWVRFSFPLFTPGKLPRDHSKLQLKLLIK